jgi:hypothetical protein
MLTGNLLSLGISAIVATSWTYLQPANFDWEITRAINTPKPESTITEAVNEEEIAEKYLDKEKMDVAETNEMAVEDGLVAAPEIDLVGLGKAFRFASISALTLAAIFLIVSHSPFEVLQLLTPDIWTDRASPIIFLPNCFRSKRLYSMGNHRNDLDFLRFRSCSHLPAL